MAQRSTNARMSRYVISGASLGSSMARFAGFSRHGSAYQKYTDLMARRRKDWNIFADDK